MNEEPKLIEGEIILYRTAGELEERATLRKFRGVQNEQCPE